MLRRTLWRLVAHGHYLAIGNFSNFYATNQVVLFAGLAFAIVPPLVAFAFLQRSFTEGLTVGASRS